MSSSNSSLLLEELVLRCDKINSILGKWNEPSRKRKEMRLPKTRVSPYTSNNQI
jgi:hypothetical protein